MTREQEATLANIAAQIDEIELARQEHKRRLWEQLHAPVDVPKLERPKPRWSSAAAMAIVVLFCLGLFGCVVFTVAQLLMRLGEWL